MPTHGQIIYDVPEQNEELSRKICHAVREFSLMVNKSVYIFPWHKEPLVKAALVEAQQELGQTCDVYVQALDPLTDAVTLDMARNSAGKIFRELYDSLQKRVDDFGETIARKLEAGELEAGKEDEYTVRRKSAMLRDAKKRLDEVETACVALRIEEASKGWVEQARKLISAQEAVVEVLREEVKARKKGTRKATA